MPIVDKLRGHTGDVDRVWWARRVDRQPDGPEWLATPFSRNGRGDEPLAESNYRVISTDIERVAAFGTDYRVDAWPGGTIHTLMVRADDALALRAVERWADALAADPIADADDLSEEEWEQDHPTNFMTGEVMECYSENEDCSCGVTDREYFPADDEEDGE
ncbi:MAG: hypothetical protein M3N52_12045 [Actinomycetota bacterium]|nr:hypothetical protein [Actinomycetota bacterium]